MMDEFRYTPESLKAIVETPDVFGYTFRLWGPCRQVALECVI